MDIVFTDHAKTRILQRNISEAEIKSVIDDPNTLQETFKQRLAARKKTSGGTLEVIYKESEGRFIIITSYWIKEA